jgi:hypothetical protein
MLYNVGMRASKSWGLALFLVLSVAAFFITPGAADDIEAVSHSTYVQLVAVEKAPSAGSTIIRAATRSRNSSTQYSQRETPDLLNLICVRLC